MPVGRRKLLNGLLAAGIAAAGAAWIGRKRVVDDLVLGEVKATLGWTLAEVADRSSYKLDLSDVQDDGAMLVTTPVVFRYAGPHGMTVPPTRFLSLGFTATLVTSVELAPQLDYLGRDKVLALAAHIGEASLAAGWRPNADAPVTGEHELAMLLADPSGPEERSWALGDFALDDAHLLMRLRRVHRAGGGFGGDQFLLNLNWRNDKLADHTDEIVKELRRQDNVPQSLWRKVDPQSYGPRAAAILRRS